MVAETVLVTGASSGIGWELSKLFAAEGCNMVLIARREERLRQLAGQLQESHGVDARVLPADLADPAAPDMIHGELSRESIHVDVVVNNAGFGAEGAFADLPVERHLSMLQVNVAALTHLTRIFLPAMLRRGQGGVLNVGSTAGFQPGPYLNVYYATKAYVLSFTEALVEELRGSGVTATCLAPGATKTEFFAAANVQHSLLAKLGQADVRHVARAGHRGFRAAQPIVVPGMLNKFGTLAVRFTPRFIVRKITARLNRPA